MAHRKNDDIQIKMASLSVARLPGIKIPVPNESLEFRLHYRKNSAIKKKTDHFKPRPIFWTGVALVEVDEMT